MCRSMSHHTQSSTARLGRRKHRANNFPRKNPYKNLKNFHLGTMNQRVNTKSMLSSRPRCTALHSTQGTRMIQTPCCTSPPGTACTRSRRRRCSCPRCTCRRTRSPQTSPPSRCRSCQRGTAGTPTPGPARRPWSRCPPGRAGKRRSRRPTR